MQIKHEIAYAATLLRQGGVVAFPTETVYGLGAAIFCDDAIRKLFSLKGRPADNPLIAHIARMSDLHLVAEEIPEEVYLLADQFWPGPLSMILKARPEVPSIARAGLPSIAVRMPAHPVALALIAEVGQPLVAPSANLSGKPSATKAEHVRKDFGDSITILDGGPCERGIESTVVDLRDPKAPNLLRPGHISREQLNQILNLSIISSNENICPGMKYRHYAPRAKVRLFYDSSTLEGEKMENCMILRRDNGSLADVTFYDSLRQADLDAVKEILILCDDQICANEGFYNRILRASDCITHSERV